MMEKPWDTLIISTCPPKDKTIRMGFSMVKDGKLYYVDGKTRICLSEHFLDTGKNVMELITDTIRYEAREAG